MKVPDEAYNGAGNKHGFVWRRLRHRSVSSGNSTLKTSLGVQARCCIPAGLYPHAGTVAKGFSEGGELPFPTSGGIKPRESATAHPNNLAFERRWTAVKVACQGTNGKGGNF